MAVRREWLLVSAVAEQVQVLAWERRAWVVGQGVPVSLVSAVEVQVSELLVRERHGAGACVLVVSAVEVESTVLRVVGDDRCAA